MHTPKTLIRLTRLLLVGAVLAGAIVPAAAAVGRPPDVQDSASAILAAHISPPDVRDAALGASVTAPDVIERFAAAHPYGTELPQGTASVSRPPDVSDTALAVQYRSVAYSKSGFDWGDWAIGIGSGMGLALFCGAFLVMTSRQLRHRVRTT